MAVFPLRPNNSGRYQQFTTVFPAGIPHFWAIDLPEPDEDATYIENAQLTNSPAQDSFKFERRTLINISSVRIVFRARRVAAAAVTCAPLWVDPSTGVTYAGTQQSMTGSYVDYSQSYTTNPATGAAWTSDSIAALEAGVITGTADLNDAVRITEIRLEVTGELPDPAGDVWGVAYGIGEAVVVNQASGSISAGASSGTLSSFSCTGNNRLLIVDVYHIDGNLAPVVYQIVRLGQSLTFLSAWGSYQAAQRMERWYLINPIQGAGSITVDFGSGNVVPHGAAIGAIACADVDLSQPFAIDLPRAGGSQTASPSITVQAGSGMLVIDGWASGDLTAGATAGSGQTELLDFEVSGAGSTYAYFASWERSAGGGTVMSWSAANPSSAWKVGLACAVRGARSGLVALPNLTGVTCHEAINQIASASFTSPYTAEIAEHATPGRDISLFHGEWGEIWLGQILNRKVNIGEAEDVTIDFTAAGQAIQLQQSPTYLGIRVESWMTPQQALDEILRFGELGSPSVWTGLLSGTGFQSLATRYDNLSLWQALLDFAEVENAFVRETLQTRQIEVSRELRSSGVVISNTSEVRAEGDPGQGLLTSGFSVSESGEHIANRVAAVGLEQGQTLLDLSQSNRSTPYTRKMAHRNLPNGTVVQQFYPIRIYKNVPFGSLNSIGKNRCAIAFLASNYPIGSGWPLLNVGGVEMGAYGAANTWNSINNLTGYQLGDIPEGEVRLEMRADTTWGDPGTDSSLTILMVQDGKQAGVAGQQNGVGTTPGSTLNVGSGVQYGDLVVGAVMTEGAGHTIGDAPWQRRLWTSGDGNFAVSYMWAQQPGDGMLWNLSYNDGWAVVLESVRVRPVTYIEDITSIEQYGRRAEFTVENTSKFTAADSSNIQAAANTLYDREVAHLDHHKQPQKTYEGIKAVLPYGPKDFLVGDAVRFVYRQTDPAISVDESLYLLERTHTYNDAGGREWDLKLSDEPVLPKTFIDLLSEELERLTKLEGSNR